MRDRLFFSLSLFWTIATSVFLTILLSIPLFAINIHLENLTYVSGLPTNVLIKNYIILILYLLNPFQTKLKMPDFPDSASALIHFAEVKNLFLLAVILVIVLAYFYWKFYKEKLSALYRRAIKIAMVFPIILVGIIALTGFDSFFITFHQILFRDRTWLFNPETDPIINVLTDNFFMYCFIIFGLIYEALLGILYFRTRAPIKTKSKK
ncbi:MAG: TIGR01906 family membrane protein [Streptococcaceae bacterium]|jgi:integral membrane protein (TIGR01906 family)|nr:TIGR01906 family membrane protein [Streptococcaceae bacterium]